MPSPFPGMNPYLERDVAWHDFHERFVILGAGILGAAVRPHYVVKVDEHVDIHDPVDWPGGPTSASPPRAARAPRRPPSACSRPRPGSGFR
jgi:hypothetical protein